MRRKECPTLAECNLNSSIQDQIKWIQQEKIVSMPNNSVLRKKTLLYRGLPFPKPDGGCEDWTPRQKYEYAQLCLTVPDVGAREKTMLCCWKCNEFNGQLTKALRKHYATFTREFSCFQPIIPIKRTPEEEVKFQEALEERDERKLNFSLDALSEATRLAFGTKDDGKDEFIVYE